MVGIFTFRGLGCSWGEDYIWDLQNIFYIHLILTTKSFEIGDRWYIPVSQKR